MPTALAACLTVLFASVVPATQTPTSITELPLTLEVRDLSALARAADAVVSATLLNSKLKMTPDERGGPPEVFTEYGFTVLEIFKHHPRLPASHANLIVKRSGGERRGAELSPHTEDHPLINGSRFILFLHWNDAAQVFYPVSDLGGMFDVSGPLVQSFGVTRAARNAVGVPVPSFLSSIKAVVPAGRKEQLP